MKEINHSKKRENEIEINHSKKRENEIEINHSEKRENKTIFIGKIKNNPIMIKVEHPILDISIFEQLKEAKHDIKVENDVYKTATVECKLNSNTKVEIYETFSGYKLENSKFFYFCESYKDYLQSEEADVFLPEIKSTVYEDDKITVFTSNPHWHCIIKNAHSIRDLTNIEDLVYIREKLYEVLKCHNLEKEELCLYFDYKGKESSLLLKIANISLGISNLESTSKFIYLDTLIKNIKTDPNYYQDKIYYIKKVFY